MAGPNGRNGMGSLGDPSVDQQQWFHQGGPIPYRPHSVDRQVFAPNAPCQPETQFLADAVKQGMIAAACVSPPTTTIPPPWQAPPFRQTPTPIIGTVMLTPPPATVPVYVTTGATQCAVARSWALNPAGPDASNIPVLSPAVIAGPVTVATFIVPENYRGAWQSLDTRGGDIVASGPGITWTVLVNNVAVFTQQNVRESPIAVNIQAAAGQVVTIVAANFDPRSASYIQARLSGWIYQVADSRVDSQAGTILRQNLTGACGS